MDFSLHSCQSIYTRMLFAIILGPPARGTFSAWCDAYSLEDLVSKLTALYIDEVEHSVAACRIWEANCLHVFWQCDFKYTVLKVYREISDNLRSYTQLKITCNTI